MMRKILVLSMLCFMMTLFCSAHNEVGTSLEFVEPDVTVIFEAGSALTYAEKMHAAQVLVYGDSSDVQTASVLCLFGHDMTVENVVLVHHRVRETEPRCDELYYTYEYCTRCDYENYQLDTTVGIVCHPVE